jgi:uncharacterized protein
MTAWHVAGFLACVAIATSAQRMTGFALALILLGLTSLLDLAPLPDIANVATILSMANAAMVMRAAHKSIDWRMLRSTVWGSVAGVAAGVTLLGWLDASLVTVLRLLLGLVIVACAVTVLVHRRALPQPSSRASFAGFGLLSGVLGGLFSASGPPLVYQFYRQPLDLDVLRDTLMGSLAVSSLLRLLIVLPTGQFSRNAFMLSLLALPVTVAITWWFQRHPVPWSRPTILKIVCGLLLVTGAGLIGPSLHAIAGRLFA